MRLSQKKDKLHTSPVQKVDSFRKSFTQLVQFVGAYTSDGLMGLSSTSTHTPNEGAPFLREAGSGNGQAGHPNGRQHSATTTNIPHLPPDSLNAATCQRTQRRIRVFRWRTRAVLCLLQNRYHVFHTSFEYKKLLPYSLDKVYWVGLFPVQYLYKYRVQVVPMHKTYECS